MHPKSLAVKAFTYDLPEKKVAKYPLPERDNSKLLVYKSGTITESTYFHIDQFLPKETLLVFNNTRVVEARLSFQKETGAFIEVFCLEPGPEYADITTAMSQKGAVRWKCLVGGASKWKHGMKLQKKVDWDGVEVLLEASIVGRLKDAFEVELAWSAKHLTFAEILHIAGFIPLPPYLHREVEENDKNRYQTIYASHDGSVAAPTAGLHFTDAVFHKLATSGINKQFVTLHVGAGTFKPVKAETMDEHEMHSEFVDVSLQAIEDLLRYVEKTIVAVGTTSLRTIESLYWMGVKVLNRPTISMEELAIGQWEPYENPVVGISSRKALTALIDWMTNNEIRQIITKTSILIAPGYELKIGSGIITNFHQPKSTLLLLIAAIVGEAWKSIYEYALDHDFRFLSYGDGCLLWKEESKVII